MNYSRFGAICKLESAQAVAPLRGHTEIAMWRHSKESRFANILTVVKVLYVLFYMKELHICAYFTLLIMYLSNVLSCCKQ